MSLCCPLHCIVIYNMFTFYGNAYRALSNMVKITAEKRMKKLNLGSNLIINYNYFQVLHCIAYACVFLCRFLSITLLLPIFLKRSIA